jgi:DNA-binding transcriptional MerR regulator
LVYKEYPLTKDRAPGCHLTLEWTPGCILIVGVMTVSNPARIGQVAHETGLSIDTIRFYEKQGLLRRSPRSEGGFRLFGSDEIETLKFVRKAQELGFSLSEIRELLILRAEKLPACSHVKELLDRKLTAVKQKIMELQKLEHSLKLALRKCKRGLKTTSPEHEECCPVLDEISQAVRG